MRTTIAEISAEIAPLLRDKLFHPTRSGGELEPVVSEFLAACASEQVGNDVEHINNALQKLGVPNTAFWSDSEHRLTALWALNANLSMFLDGSEETWVFRYVVPGGVAAEAGIKAGDILTHINHEPVRSSPRFRLGESYVLTLISRDGKGGDVSITLPSNTDQQQRPPLAEPPPLSTSVLQSRIGLINVSAFPGIIGSEFAQQLTSAVRSLQKDCSRYVIDLRSNHGGGLGSLRLMSHLTSEKLPVGHSLTREARDAKEPVDSLPVIDSIPETKLGITMMAMRFKFLHKGRSLRLVTEGIERPLGERVTILIDESTRGGAENVAAFAKANGLATLVGAETPGENLGAANFTIAEQYHLRIPLVGWFAPNGSISQRVAPDYSVVPTLTGLRTGVDEVLDKAIELLQ